MPACLLEDAIASYKLYAEAEGRSRRTIDEKIRVVREFCRFLSRDDLSHDYCGRPAALPCLPAS